MSEEDYKKLQILLVKFRAETMKEYGNPAIQTKKREKDLKIIRNIDYLRNNTILKEYGG